MGFVAIRNVKTNRENLKFFINWFFVKYMSKPDFALSILACIVTPKLYTRDNQFSLEKQREH